MRFIRQTARFRNDPGAFSVLGLDKKRPPEMPVAFQISLYPIWNGEAATKRAVLAGPHVRAAAGRSHAGERSKG